MLKLRKKLQCVDNVIRPKTASGSSTEQESSLRVIQKQQRNTTNRHTFIFGLIKWKI